MDWNETYAETSDFFGSEPDPVVHEYRERLHRRSPVLDIGSGQGRNALYLAREGFVVHAIDPSSVALRDLESAASSHGLKIEVWTGVFEDYPALSGSYGTVLAMGLIPILGRDEVDALSTRIRDWTIAGGLVFVTAFTTADPSYSRFAQDSDRIGRHSFALPDGCIRTFLEPDEAPALFPGFEVLRHREGPGPGHRHGDGPVHRHALVELVLKRDAIGGG